jgi:exopolysaccharide biosynthesis predicted pyruvyltransferase EpsI
MNAGIDVPVDIAAYLQPLSGRKVLYCPNPGNAGDSLIASATYQLFEHAGVQHQTVEWDEDFDATGQTLLYGGGGNLTTQYRQARHFLERHHGSAQRLILLPHTVEGHADLLHQLGGNVEVLCREKRSLAWVREQTDGPKVHLAEDLAFHLDIQQVMTNERVAGERAMAAMAMSMMRSALRRFSPWGERFASAWRLKRAWTMNVMGLKGLLWIDREVLHALRVDAESTEVPVPCHNVDVSRVFEYGVSPPDVAFQASAAMLSYVNAFQHVITNRLHGCIAAALLGKTVDFYANSYYKNEAVYAFSIKERYPAVRWCGE